MTDERRPKEWYLPKDYQIRKHKVNDDDILVREVLADEIRPTCWEVHKEDQRIIVEQKRELDRIERALAKAKEFLAKIGNGEAGHFAAGFAQKSLKEIEAIEKGELK